MAYKNISSVYAEVFCYPTEDKDRVIEAIGNVLPAEKYKEEKIKSYYDPDIIKISYKTTKSKEIKPFIETMQNTNITQPLSRLDDRGTLRLRFDKQNAFSEKLVLTEHGDVIAVKIKIVSHPFRIEKIKETVRELFY